MKETVERNGRFYTNEKGEIKTENEQLKEWLIIANKENERLTAENKRLNNIINEFEKYINENYIYDEVGMKIFDASTLQDKLQELKGVDKE